MQRIVAWRPTGRGWSRFARIDIRGKSSRPVDFFGKIDLICDALTLMSSLMNVRELATAQGGANARGVGLTSFKKSASSSLYAIHIEAWS